MRRWLLAVPWLLILAGVAWWAVIPAAHREEILSAVRGDATSPAPPVDDDGAGTGDKPAAASEADDEASPPSRVERVDGLNAVRISVAAQQQTGIALLELIESTHQSETLATGRVLDVAALVQLRAEVNAARGEESVARSALAASSRAAARLRVLNREDGNVSTRQLQEAESAAAADAARAESASRRIQDLRNVALAKWGPTLVGMALADRSPDFDALVAGQDVLVLVTMRPGEELPAGIGFIYVGPTGERLRARKAYFVAPAAQTDDLAPGETYLFRTNAAKLRLGMRMDAWIPRPGEPNKGVEVPGAAVIWYANKLWVYALHGDEQFVRRPLNAYEETRDGWFVTNGVRAGDRIVVSGAQMLFSEEFRSAIPSEDEARE